MPDTQPETPEFPELIHQWWTWAMASPMGQDPVTDPSGERAGLGQPDGPVWMVAGTFGGEVHREWTMPAGRRLFFPVLCMFTRPFLVFGRSPRLEPMHALATLDGAPHKPTPVKLTGLPVHAAAGNPFTESDVAADLRIVTVGLWVLTEPLTAGKHDLAFSGATEDFSLDVTCRITAV